MASFRKFPSRLTTSFAGRSAGETTASSRRPLIVRLLVRVGILVVDYLLLGLLGFVVIPTLGEFMFGMSAVASDSRATLSQQLTYWLVPFIALTLILVVGVLVSLRGLWRAGTRWLDAPRAADRRVNIAETVAADEPVVETKSVRVARKHQPRRTSSRSNNNGKKVATS